jgi:hypothetical protein
MPDAEKIVKTRVTQLTVWADVDRGVRCIGVLFCTRLSHRTICPEYVPPSTRLGWNLKHKPFTMNLSVPTFWRNLLASIFRVEKPES